MRKVKSHLASGSGDVKAGGLFPVTSGSGDTKGGVMVGVKHRAAPWAPWGNRKTDGAEWCEPQQQNLSLDDTFTASGKWLPRRADFSRFILSSKINCSRASVPSHANTMSKYISVEESWYFSSSNKYSQTTVVYKCAQRAKVGATHPYSCIDSALIIFIFIVCI